MMKLMSFLLVVAFAAVGLADAEVPLPGPGAPPTEPAPPQPTPTLPPEPTPPPNDPYPGPTPYPSPTPYPTPPSNPGDDITYTLGMGQVGRFRSRNFTFRPPSNLKYIRALRLTCTNTKIKIKSVQVHYSSGAIEEQVILNGTYSLGSSRVSYLQGQRVHKVIVTAGSSSVFKANGSFRLDAAAKVTRTRELDEPEENFAGPEFPSEDAGAY